MNATLQTPRQLLLSVTSEELNGICNALNEVCHGVHIEDPEFETRLGAPRAFLAGLLDQLLAGVKHPALKADTRAAAWADGGSVQAICVTAGGDPADMSAEEARVFADQLRAACAKAEG
jgi:hypothetical protein